MPVTLVAAGSVAQGYLHMSPDAGLGTIASVVVLQPEGPGGEIPPQVCLANSYRALHDRVSVS